MFEDEFWPVLRGRDRGKGNQSWGENKKAGRLYEAEKFRSPTNICGVKVLGTFYLFLLQILKFPVNIKIDQSKGLELAIPASTSALYETCIQR